MYLARFWILLLASIAVTTHAAEGATVAPFTQSANYPSRPIRFLVGVAPGGGTDFAARLVGGKLSEKFGQPVITDNRTGATGNIALELTAKAAPDGHTFLVFNIGHLTSALLSRSGRVDANKDFAPVSQIATGTLVLVMHAGVPAKNLKDFIAYARGKPGQVNYGSGGIASNQHLAMELFKREARVDLQHVPYKGTGPIAVDLVSGQIQVAISSLLGFYPHVKAGRLKPLVVARKTRFPGTPDVPSSVVAGFPELDSNAWFGLFAPAKTPKHLILRVNKEVANALNTPQIRDTLLSQGAEVAPTTPEAFGDYVKAEVVKWTRVVKEAGIK